MAAVKSLLFRSKAAVLIHVCSHMSTIQNFASCVTSACVVVSRGLSVVKGSRQAAAVKGYLGAAGLVCAFGLSAIADTQFSLGLGRLQLHVRASIVSAVYRCCFSRSCRPGSLIPPLAFAADVTFDPSVGVAAAADATTPLSFSEGA